MIGAAVVVLGVLGAAYFKLDGKLDVLFSRLDDKIADSIKTSTRIETKLDDLIARVPPVQTPLKTK